MSSYYSSYYRGQQLTNDVNYCIMTRRMIFHSTMQVEIMCGDRCCNSINGAIIAINTTTAAIVGCIVVSSSYHISIVMCHCRLHRCIISPRIPSFFSTSVWWFILRPLFFLGAGCVRLLVRVCRINRRLVVLVVGCLRLRLVLLFLPIWVGIVATHHIDKSTGGWGN